MIGTTFLQASNSQSIFNSLPAKFFTYTSDGARCTYLGSNAYANKQVMVNSRKFGSLKIIKQFNNGVIITGYTKNNYPLKIVLLKDKTTCISYVNLRR